ncbi:hypothetical protein FQR65_LT12012 [Abscondita terminalis]|nr:hypothetical protein FQR65_LT12012 [Abscondita terminalis]
MNQAIHSLNLPRKKTKELRDAGYHYCKDMHSLKPTWPNLMETLKAKTALEVFEEECRLGYLCTFVDSLDHILKGGIPLGQITEFCGEPGSGKTQLCFQLCVCVQLPTWCGGLCGEAVYISTNSNFARHRVKEIAEGVIKRYNKLKIKYTSKMQTFDELTVESILEKISYISAQDHIELLAVVAHVKEWLPSHPSVKVIVIDSICAPLQHADNTKHIVCYQVFEILQRLAVTYNFAIVVTNNITTRFEANNSFYQTASLGDSYYHRINNRICLSKKNSSVFEAAVLKSAFTAPSKVEFNLFP